MTLFSDTSTILEEVSIDYDNEVAIYDDYYDDMYAIESNKFSMLVDHEKNALCNGYIDESIHDATSNYYERGTYDAWCSLCVSNLIFYVSIIESSCLA